MEQPTYMNWTSQVFSDLKEDERFKLTQLLKNFEEIGTESVEKVGVTHEIEHDIILNGKTPAAHPPQRLSLSQTTEVRKQLDILLESKKIRLSKSPWASRLVLVRKANGSIGMCTNYRALNARSIPDAFPLPRIDDLFSGETRWKRIFYKN